MPESNLQSHHPVILEYWTDEDEKIEVATDFEELKDLYSLTATTLTKQDKILSLLTVITNHMFFRYYDLTGTWGMPILEDNPGEKANEWSSKWNMVMFHWPGLPDQLKITEFSQPEIEEVEYVRHFDYYLHDPNFDNYSNKVITFPHTINVVLDSYFAKGEEIKTILDAAISYSVAAMELRPHKKTLSLLSSFTSVETMVNLEFENFEPEKCDTCGQLQHKVSKKYREYLFKYIGKSSNNRKKFNKYYSLRSKIVHTGQRLKTENLYADISQEEKDEELLSHMEILQMGKLAITHWLIRNK